MKCCAVCKLNLGEGCFHKHRGNKDGLQAMCKSCHAEKNRQYRTKRAERWSTEDPLRQAGVEKHCGACGLTKAAGHFQRSRTASDGLQNRCRECSNAAGSKRMREHPEYRKSAIGKYRRARPEVILAGSAVVRALRTGELKKGLCERCGGTNTHAHHHISYREENQLDVMWLCPRCHSDWHAWFGPVV